MVERWVDKNERCGRNDGKTWRCKMAAVPALSFCAHHRQHLRRSRPRPPPRGAPPRRARAAISPRSSAAMGAVAVSPSCATRDPRRRFVSSPSARVAIARHRRRPGVSRGVRGARVHHLARSRGDGRPRGDAARTRADATLAPPPLSPLRLGKDASSSDIIRGPPPPPDDEYFRANALVHEREGAWTPFHLYEVKIMAAAAEAFAPPARRAVHGDRERGVHPGGRGGVVGGVVVGASSGRSDPAADAEAFAAARRLATGPEERRARRSSANRSRRRGRRWTRWRRRSRRWCGIAPGTGARGGPCERRGGGTRARWR